MNNPAVSSTPNGFAGGPGEKVRLDKWLWAARFFKTRSLAKQAIDGGKVHYNDQRSKVSKEVEIGALLRIRQGYDELEVAVVALSGQRGSAPQARLLYMETPSSTERRAKAAAERKALADSAPDTSERPDKKQRRSLQRLKQELFE
jgi:ribosome-associated heat shock protein Hsp15